MFVFCFFFFKQKTAYEMRISDWSSDVCSSDLQAGRLGCNAANLIFARKFAAAVDTDGPRRIAFCVQALFFAVEDVIRGQVHEEIGRASCRERVCQYV